MNANSGLGEAAMILELWSRKVGAVLIKGTKFGDKYCLQAYASGGAVVGQLRWERGRRTWHVVVGMDSWSVNPESSWNADEMDAAVRTMIQYGYDHHLQPEPVNPSADILGVAL